jgi:hypothetical protein
VTHTHTTPLQHTFFILPLKSNFLHFSTIWPFFQRKCDLDMDVSGAISCQRSSTVSGRVMREHVPCTQKCYLGHTATFFFFSSFVFFYFLSVEELFSFPIGWDDFLINCWLSIGQSLWCVCRNHLPISMASSTINAARSCHTILKDFILYDIKSLMVIFLIFSPMSIIMLLFIPTWCLAEHENSNRTWLHAM